MDDFDGGFDGGGFDVSDVGSDAVDIADVEVDISDDIMTDTEVVETLDDIEPLDDSEIDINISDEIEPATDDFEQRIDEMSLDELNVERERLVELGALDAEQLAQQYDDFMAEQAVQEQFDGLTDGLSAEQLEEMKTQLLSGNQEMLDTWGLNNDTSEDSGDAKVLRR